MKYPLLSVGFVAAVTVALGFWFMQTPVTPAQPAPQVPPPASTQHKFLELCTGLPVTAAEVSAASCLGYIRGFADAHSVTVKMVNDQSVQLWCIDPTVTAGQLYDVVKAWVDVNPDRVAQFETLGRNNVGAAAIIAALHATFPCKKVSSPT